MKRIKEIIEKSEDDEAQERMKVAMSHLEGVEGKVKEEDMWPAIQTLLSQVTAQAEQQIIQAQVPPLHKQYLFVFEVLSVTVTHFSHWLPLTTHFQLSILSFPQLSIINCSLSD